MELMVGTQAAALALADKIGSHVVECRPKDRDRFNRRVAVCFVGGEDINAWMVANGWALAYRGITQVITSANFFNGIGHKQTFSPPS